MKINKLKKWQGEASANLARRGLGGIKDEVD